VARRVIPARGGSGRDRRPLCRVLAPTAAVQQLRAEAEAETAAVAVAEGWVARLAAGAGQVVAQWSAAAGGWWGEARVTGIRGESKVTSTANNVSTSDQPSSSSMPGDRRASSTAWSTSPQTKTRPRLLMMTGCGSRPSGAARSWGSARVYTAAKVMMRSLVRAVPKSRGICV